MAPSDATEAVDLLLARCPELEPAWRALAAWMGESTGEAVGIYIVFGQLVLPLLLYALDGHGAGLNWAEQGAAHRSSFVEQPEWRDIPRRGSPDPIALIQRLYQVLDLWATSKNVNLRDAVYIEMVESGYVDLTADDLLRTAGPALRQLAAAHSK